MSIQAQIYAETVAKEVLGMIDKQLKANPSDGAQEALLALRDEVDSIRRSAHDGWY